MMYLLPASIQEALKRFLFPLFHKVKGLLKAKKARYKLAVVIDLILIIAILLAGRQPTKAIFSPLVSSLAPLTPLTQVKNSHEVFGFAPYWNINKLSNIDFNILTTLAYFGIEIEADGHIVKDSPDYNTFRSRKATELFKKAHSNGTRVVLTLTQMGNSSIIQLMDDDNGQQIAINEAVNLVKQRGIDGLNVDFEYSGNPGQEYRDKFTQFVTRLTEKMHQEIAGSYVTVSVYATSVKDPKIYDIAALGQVTDGIFMMAYDFAVAKSKNAIPTAPLYGYRNGKYWYDIATSVDDFLRFIPPNKLILGVPYYGYNYLVYEPTVKAQTRPLYSWRGSPASQTYTTVQDKFDSEPEGVDQVLRGWDDDGKVGFIAYHITETDTWRMIFMEDSRSLGIKYDFAKEKRLGGVGMWALGNDNGKQELWALLKEKFGVKQLAKNDLSTKVVNEIE